MAQYEWDESQWPLVRVTLGPRMSEADIEETHDLMRQLLARRSVCAVLHDVRQSRPVGVAQLQKGAELMKELEPLAQLYVAGTAVVVASAIQQAMMTAILWVRPTSYPLIVVSSLREGEAWTREQLRRRQGDAASLQ